MRSLLLLLAVLPAISVAGDDESAGKNKTMLLNDLIDKRREFKLPKTEGVIGAIGALYEKFDFAVAGLNSAVGTGVAVKDAPKEVTGNAVAGSFRKKGNGIRPSIVRKNYKDLTQQEWDDFIAAVKIMKTTSETEGQAIYGENFQNYDTLVIKHGVGVLDSVCNRQHYGPAFPWFHRMFVTLFERSILSIIAVEGGTLQGIPYWDAQKDVALYGLYSKSPLFTDQFLGGGGVAPDFAVTDGPFAGEANWSVTAPDDAPLRNPYGLLRSPFNPNPTLGLTRRFENYCGLPYPELTIYSAEACINLKEGGVAGITACMDPAVHGNAHLQVGGTWGNEKTPECFKLFQPVFTVKYQGEGSQVSYFLVPGPVTEQWSRGCLDCPEDCTGLPLEECFCEYKDRDDPKAAFECVDGQPLAQSFPKWAAGAVGDFGDIAFSPNDPLFFLHHANVDRVFTTWQVNNQKIASEFYEHPEVYWFNDKLLQCPGHGIDDIVNEPSPFLSPYGNVPPGEPVTIRQIIEATIPGWSLEYDYDKLLDGVSAKLELQREEYTKQESGPIEGSVFNGPDGLDLVFQNSIPNAGGDDYKLKPLDGLSFNLDGLKNMFKD
uniref:Tyrosinase copper-binding domain-containing protein n=1 Tax=Chromera velia CCMP2878 TaxID=1169474 RepID=A0A0G4GTR9_9ALVE|mmetsp:Transcript_42500/g.83792  ORF Transcript_42500/g.83792 Transcript_42500/m.83792 type:complete len:602 (-) Transcript_42500:637-2442(-)|eukprot:Cvel_5198.t1-p1 / transcript=Cvel_5198.t1 / gene=Cvel_5198 / organism=Chromera_velia_CCMP2878 / gene_product=Tyrosinase, putative / transcript_product=Tyrosinase, putative / location=Cvel_scaffold239:27486-29982(+) / protein_length=601 / sequence_SO=supercontig / SO=protein_coding / is_pseudo=false